MRTRFRFEKLEVWQEARAINQAVYPLTKEFPRRESLAMTSQIRRASISVSSNIAEGPGRSSDRDLAHFLEQSHGSVMELASVFFLALDEGYVKDHELDRLLDELEKLARRIASLNRSLRVDVGKTPFARNARQQGAQPSESGARPSTLDSRPPCTS
jgi:four helix bundle protein